MRRGSNHLPCGVADLKAFAVVTLGRNATHKGGCTPSLAGKLQLEVGRELDFVTLLPMSQKMAPFPFTMSTFSAILAFVSQVPSIAATPLSILTPRANQINEWSPGWPSCFLGHECPGLWPSVDNETDPALNITLFDSIHDVAQLSEAALGAISAPHFDYFFERNATIENLVKTVFTNIAALAELKAGRFSLVFADLDPLRGYKRCFNNDGTYSYAPGGSTQYANSGGGSLYMCDRALKLPRDPTPCTTLGAPGASLGYALLRAAVQSMAIIDPDNSGTLFDGLDINYIQDMNGRTGDWNTKELGWGSDGEDGLMGSGVGNAANWATFAVVAWNGGYAPPEWQAFGNGTTCPSQWTKHAAEEGLVPIS